MRNPLYRGAAIIALIACGNEVRAAGMDRPVPFGPPILAAPFAVWTGCFVGGSGGAASARWQQNFLTAPTNQRNGGAALGGQLGCDYQLGAWIVGVRGMFDWTDLKSTFSQLVGIPLSVTVNEPWFTTATGRIGYTIEPSILAYARGGFGWSQQGRTGWTAGVGLDWKCLPNLSLFVEYDHLGLGTKNITLGTVPPLLGSYKVDVESVLVGFDYRFNMSPWVTTRY
jgi:outer membrane immunogenic protein